MTTKAHALTFSYTSADALVHERLRQHLQPLAHAGLIHLHDMLQPIDGAFSRARVAMQLMNTELLVPILSPDFVDSRARCGQLEAAVERARAGQLMIMPLLARAIDLEATPLAGIACVGHRGQALDRADNLDAALHEIAVAVRRGFEPLVRDPDPAPVHEPERGSGAPRRVLCLFATPSGFPSLQLGTEQRAIQSAAAEATGVTVDYCPATTFNDVHRAVLDRDYDIVHFSGHHSRDWGLVLEDGRGNPQPIVAASFIRLLRKRPSIRALVLNTCDSIDVARLCAADMDYVVAMEGEIDDRAASHFSEFFYRALARGEDMQGAFDDGMCNATARHGACFPARLMGSRAGGQTRGGGAGWGRWSWRPAPGGRTGRAWARCWTSETTSSSVSTRA